MSKRKITFKKILCIMLTLLLANEKFAAIVSDNDGSAFVTKKEFEALKADFTSQIDNYNSSIDNKIDGSIASYLTGVNIAKNPNMLFDSIKKSQGGAVHFWNEAPYVGSDTIVPEVVFDMTRHYTVKMMTNVVDLPSIQHDPNGDTMIYNQIGAGTLTTDGHRYTNTDMGENAWLRNNGSNQYKSLGSLWWPSTGSWTNYNSAYENNQKINYQWDINKKDVGSGSTWVYHTQPNGSRVLRHFALSYYPLQSIVAWAHTYKDKGGIRATLNSAQYGDSTSISKVTIPAPTSWDKTSGGTKRGDGSETNGNYWEQTVRIISTNTTRDYSIIMIGKNADAAIYTISDNATFSAGSQKSETIGSQTFNSIYYAVTGTMGTNTVTGYTVEYTPITFSTEAHTFNDFANQYATPLAGEVIYLGSGIPLCMLNDEGKVELKIKFKILSEDLATVYPGKKLYWKISNKKFLNNSVDTANGGELLGEGNIITGSDGTVLLETIVEANNKDYLWLTTYAEDSHRIVSIESCDAKMT